MNCYLHVGSFMVNLRINWTLYTGEVRKPRLPRRVKCLFIFQVYHSFKGFIGFYASFVRFPAKLGNFAYRVGGEKLKSIHQI